MRLINLFLPVNFDGEVLDANAVVAVSAAIRRSEPEPIEPVLASFVDPTALKVDRGRPKSR